MFQRGGLEAGGSVPHRSPVGGGIPERRLGEGGGVPERRRCSRMRRSKEEEVFQRGAWELFQRGGLGEGGGVPESRRSSTE